MDDELPDHEMAMVREHLHACSECRREMEAFGEISRAVSAAICSVPAPQRGRSLRRALVVSGAIAAALTAVALLWPHRAAGVRLPVETRVVAPAQPVNSHVTPTATVARKRHRIAKHVPTQVVWMPADPTVQIVIPADALFPPGALPDGIDFVADLRLAANGSPASVALRP